MVSPPRSGKPPHDADGLSAPVSAGITDSTPLPDDILLHNIAEGDQDAMTAVFDRYSKVVYSVSLRVLRDPGLAEDVLQDIFMQIWKKPSTFIATRGSLGSWLAVVARNRSIDFLRRRKPTNEIEDMVLASPFNLAEDSERALMMQRARDVMDGLPAQQRYVLELAYFEGMTHSEIAERTGDPLGTVKTRIRSALMVLRRAMQP